MIIGFGNNVVSALASDITATQTSIAVMPGAGEKFASLLTTDISSPGSPHGIYAKLTLTDSQQTVFEICHLMSVTQDTLAVLRGQEGTQAKGWSLNDVIANFATRGSEQQFVQIEALQAGDYTAAKAGGTANALAISLTSTFFNNESTDWQLNTPLIITPTVTNTGAATLQVTISGKVVGTYPLVKGNNTALQAGDIVAKNPFVVVFSSEQERFTVLNPTTEIGVVRSVNNIGPGVGGNVVLPMYGLGMGPQHKDDAFSDVAQIYRINSSSASTPGGSVYGVICLPCDGAPSAAYLAAGNNGELHVGRSTTASKGVLWNRVYTTAYKPTAADVNALPITGGTMTGEIKSTSSAILRGIQGGYGAMWRMDANAFYYLLTNPGDPNGNFNSLRPLTIINNTGNVNIGTALSVDSQNSIYKTGIHTYSDGGGSYNQTNGMTLQGVGDQVGEMYFLENIGKYAHVGLHARSGGRDAWYEFRHDGNIFANGTNVAPVGVIEAWPSDVPPTGWLMCDGSGFNTGVFPNLALIFPSGQLPDLRGAFLRGKDNGKGVDPNRGLLSIQPGQAPASAIGGGEWGNYAGRDTGHTVGTGTDNTGTYRVMQETEQQRETRPYNVAINYIVRAA
ncbi:phage tail fiber protein [Serratia sp. CY76391]|uniref:phage tail protein n=1 Tax=Serratia sp. CY76391 TaxID=3383681 RepID=UPI003FA13C2D